MSFGDFNAYDNALDQLLSLNKTIFFEEFVEKILKNEEIFKKIETVIYKKLWVFFMNFCNDLSFFREEEAVNLEGNLRKSSFYSNKDPRTSSFGNTEFFTEKTRNNEFFSEKTRKNENSVINFKEKIDAETARFFSRQIRDFCEKSKELRYSRKHEKKLKLKRFFEKKENFHDFCLKITGKIGFSYQRKLIFLGEMPISLIKNRRVFFDFAEKEQKIKKILDFQHILKPEDFESPVSSEVSLKSTKIENFEENDDFHEKEEKIEKKAFKKLEIFLEIYDISEEITGFFAIALLKDFLIDSLLIFGKTRVFIIENYTLDPQGNPIEIFENADKSKFFLKKPQISQISLEILPETSQKDHKSHEIFYNELLEIHAKRYLLKPCAIELFLSEKTFFLICNQFSRDSIFCHFCQILQKTSKPPKIPKTSIYFLVKTSESPLPEFTVLSPQSLLSQITPLWEISKISNFDYIMLLNLLSGRTYSDLSQYPVFPWILSNFSTKELSLENPLNYRDLSRPIGAINEEKAAKAKEKYKYTSEEKLFPGFHHGSHYSSQTLVIYYMIRILPFSKFALNLQGGKFDLSDRLFHSIEESWLLTETLDVKELIPELFFLPESLLNLNEFDFGKTQNSAKVHDLLLPLWCRQEPRFFCNFMRKSAESVNTSSSIHKWIDLIFGARQTGKLAIEALNMYFFLTYEGVKIEKLGEKERNGLLDQINEYGQTPKQLFSALHVEKKRNPRNSAFFAKEKSLRRLKPELYHILERFYGKYEISFENLPRNSGILGKFPYLSQIMKEIAITSEGNYDRISNESLGSMLILYEGQCVLKSGKSNKETVFLDFSQKNCFSLIKNNEIFQRISKPKQAISCVKAYQQGNLLIISTELGEISLFSYEEISCFNEEIIGLSFENSRNFELENLAINSPLLSTILNKNFVEEIPKFQRFSSVKSPKNQRESLKLPINYTPDSNRRSILRESVGFPTNNLAFSSRNYRFIHKKKFSGFHQRKVHILEISSNFGVFLSLDEGGTLCIWDLCGKFIRKLRISHFSNKKIYEKIFDLKKVSSLKKIAKINEEEKKGELQREKPVFLSFLEENGDFAIISANYLSVYNINGVLLAIEKIEKARFSSCLIVGNKDVFEDDYIITGNSEGKLQFFVLNLEEKRDGGYRYSDYYKDSLGVFKGKIQCPYTLKCVFQISLGECLKRDQGFEGGEKVLEIGQIYVCFDQKSMFTCHRNSEIYQWFFRFFCEVFFVFFSSFFCVFFLCFFFEFFFLKFFYVFF